MGSTQPAGAQCTSGDVGDHPEEERPQLSLGSTGACAPLCPSTHVSYVCAVWQALAAVPAIPTKLYMSER